MLVWCITLSLIIAPVRPHYTSLLHRVLEQLVLARLVRHDRDVRQGAGGAHERKARLLVLRRQLGGAHNLAARHLEGASAAGSCRGSGGNLSENALHST